MCLPVYSNISSTINVSMNLWTPAWLEDVNSIFFGQKLIHILRNSSPITVRGGPPLTEEEEKEEGEKETEAEVHWGKAMKKKPNTVSCQSVHDFFITDSPEPVDVCNQQHAWLVTSVVSNRGVATPAPFVLSHLWVETKQLLYDFTASSCIFTPDRRSGHAGVRAVHCPAAGVQVGVSLVGKRVIHVHVCVSANLRRASPWRLGRRDRKSNSWAFVVCLCVLKLWLQWFFHLPELWGGMCWLVAVNVSQVSQSAGWGFTQCHPEEGHQDEGQGQDRQDQGSRSQRLSRCYETETCQTDRILLLLPSVLHLRVAITFLS